jgi:RHS repeat-associated protein
MTDSSGITDFILDGQSVVREKKDGVYKATYLTGPRGIEYRKDDANGEVRWYLYDGLGSVIGEVDNTGTITSTHQTDVYGNTLLSSGTSTTDHKFIGKLGHRTESGTNGLIYMGARYYDPTLGRFISEDPAKDGNNWYTYCNNNPVNLVDSDGKIAGPAAAVWLATSTMFFTSLGTVIGYVMASYVIQMNNPAFEPNFKAMFGGIGFNALQTAGLLYADIKTGISNISMKKFMPKLNLYGEIGFVLGIISGIGASLVEYYTSEAFINGKEGI